jgi:hypothetical protein
LSECPPEKRAIDGKAAKKQQRRGRSAAKCGNEGVKKKIKREKGSNFENIEFGLMLSLLLRFIGSEKRKRGNGGENKSL